MSDESVYKLQSREELKRRLQFTEEEMAAPPADLKPADPLPMEQLVLAKVERCWTRSAEKSWGQWTPLGEPKAPTDLIVKSHAEYVAVCEVRFRKQLHAEQRHKQKSRVVQSRFDTLRKKMTSGKKGFKS